MEAGLWPVGGANVAYCGLWADPLFVRIRGPSEGQRSRGSPLSCVIWHNGENGDVTTEGNAPWRT